MKKKNKVLFTLLVVVVLALAIPVSVSAAPIEDGKTVFGESYTLESDKILEGDLNVIGGVVDIETDAVVNGDMFVLGGVVDIDGTIEGSLTVIGGTVNLTENARIEGDLVAPAGFVDSEEGATIVGSQEEGWHVSWFDINMPRIYGPRMISLPGVHYLPVFNMAQTFGKTLVFVALGALMLLIMPKSAQVMSESLVNKPWHILGYGALTALTMLVGGILLAITICLIPVVVIVGLAFALALLAGWLTLGYELGKRLEKVFKTTWHPVVSAILGNLALYLTAQGLTMIECIGSFLVFIAMLFGLGMAVVTLFGTRPYPRPEKETPDEETPVLLIDGMESPEKPQEEESEQDKTSAGESKGEADENEPAEDAADDDDDEETSES
jgi:hypothetical protein